MHALRNLSFDDLFLLRALGEGKTLSAISKELSLTQPALTQRLRKIEQVFADTLLQKEGRRLVLTEAGRSLVDKAASAISIMSSLEAHDRELVINVGTRPETGLSWLWPAVCRLRKQQANLTFHCNFSSGPDLLQRLSRRELDAVLTSAPHLSRDFQSISLVREDYVFAASSQCSLPIHQLRDLKNHTLIEHDRSFPFLHYLSGEDRALIEFADVWFTGSTQTMVEAIVQNLGVGIVPKYIARAYLENQSLKTILPELNIDFDHFRLVFLRESRLELPMQLLSNMMKSIAKPYIPSRSI